MGLPRRSRPRRRLRVSSSSSSGRSSVTASTGRLPLPCCPPPLRPRPPLRRRRRRPPREPGWPSPLSLPAPDRLSPTLGAGRLSPTLGAGRLSPILGSGGASAAPLLVVSDGRADSTRRLLPVFSDMGYFPSHHVDTLADGAGETGAISGSSRSSPCDIHWFILHTVRTVSGGSTAANSSVGLSARGWVCLLYTSPSPRDS